MGHRKARFRHADPLASMPWDEFERLMARHYAARGYRVEHSGTGAQTSWKKFDGGIDLKLFRDGEYIVVQCKRVNFFEVTHNVVHELIGVMHTQHATRAIVVITGSFSAAAIAAAAEFPQIELIDGVALRHMLAETGDSPTTHWPDEVLSSMAGTRPSGPSWRQRNRTPAAMFVVTLLTVGMLILGYYIVIPAVFRNMTTSLVHPTQRAATTRPAPIVVRTAPYIAAGSSSRMPGGEATASPPSQPPSAFTKLSKKDAEEWDRKNAESMRILEKTTPSLP
jgi:restriction system protein